MTKCNRVHRCSAIALIAAVSLLAGGNLSAQELSFRHLTIDDGLSQNAVYSILKGSQGFMWFSTEDGLNRYDGRNFKVYQHDPFDEMQGKLIEDRGPKNVDGMTEDGGRTTESPFELPSEASAKGGGGAEIPDGTEVGDVSSMEYKPKLSVRTHKTGKSVTIKIEDNGSGTPDYIKDKIMQPFFTMKKGSLGIGLGLNITNDTVKAHGSTINIKTEEHGGATFIIELHV